MIFQPLPLTTSGSRSPQLCQVFPNSHQKVHNFFTPPQHSDRHSWALFFAYFTISWQKQIPTCPLPPSSPTYRSSCILELPCSTSCPPWVLYPSYFPDGTSRRASPTWYLSHTRELQCERFHQTPSLITGRRLCPLLNPPTMIRWISHACLCVFPPFLHIPDATSRRMFLPWYLSHTRELSSLDFRLFIKICSSILISCLSNICKLFSLI